MKKINCWLSDFNLEYISADFSHGGVRIHKVVIEEKFIVSTGKKRKFDIGKKDAQDRNNARNTDAFSVTKANRILEGEEEIERGANKMKSTNYREVEDLLIKLIDLRRRR